MKREPDNEILDGTLCGARYRILARIATGGMAEVLEGDDVVLGRRVAIKVLRENVAEEPPEGESGERERETAHLADRMRVEARALALVAHPNVVAAYDLGTTADGRPFIVTERLSGRALDAELRERSFLPWREAVDVVRRVLSALDAAHEKGVVHRDVKPGNVFRCTDGGVKLLDFGVAKIVGEASLKHVAPGYRTKDGALVGTPKYTTPEQACAGPVDGRTDVYAAGLLLYGLIAGRHAFDGERDVIRLVDAMREGAEAPSKHASQPLPAALDAAVLKALAWLPEERFQSAAAFAEALRAIVEPADDPDEPTVAYVPERGLPQWAFALIAAATAAAAFAALASIGGMG